MVVEREITWQDAVATLTTERERAEAAVAALKARGEAAAIAEGARLYDQGRAEFNGVIAGLQLVIRTTNGTPDSLADLIDRLNRGAGFRQALERLAKPARPAAPGVRSWVSDAADKLVGPLVAAVRTLYENFRADDHLRRETIANSLESARWSAFDAIPSR